MISELTKHNPLLSSIIIFLVFFTIITIIKPPFIFNRDGSIKDFGLGYSSKTVLPIWLLVIILSILSYLAISYITLLS